MIAGLLKAPGVVEVTDFPEPPLAEDGVKIAVAWCGLCGTDFHKYAGKAGSRPVTYPVPLGHEASGVVVEVGAAVTDLRPGDRVTVDPNHSCGKCHFCRTGRRHLCTASRGVVKGLATYICPPRENVYRIPDHLSLRDAALAEPISCCLHGLDLLDTKPGETVAIVGFGAIGVLMCDLLRGIAGKIIVIEPQASKRETAEAMGVTLFLDPTAGDLPAKIEAAGIPSVDRVIECGGIPATVELALEVAGPGATVVLFGVAAPEARVAFSPYDAFRRELVIKTSYINPGTMQRAIDLLARGGIDMRYAVSRVIELDELPEEMETRRYSRLGKVIVRVDPNTQD